MNPAWADFYEEASSVLRSLMKREMTLDQASSYFENSSSISNTELKRYLEYLVWEVDAEPDPFKQILTLFESGAAETDMVEQLRRGGQLRKHYHWPWD